MSPTTVDIDGAEVEVIGRGGGDASRCPVRLDLPCPAGCGWYGPAGTAHICTVSN
ncbi:hypothetical protein [Streptomyces lonarensis]|uniref:Uncharacterized protein n=1 Tax=Streptomyces lonarensis TaxID=700599 RepID=A0A7X6CXK8_9ACTN|nr:hypothetical protein [Streptomyces lonarensis]NJQ04264.1 hypothetical protein [Streptomyces lonarensis]